MLSYLSVQNLGIIEDLDITFNKGFNVLTGETGAGKTLLVEALAILSGDKVSQSLIGPFGENCLIEAEFIDRDLNKVSMVRSLNRSGKSRCWINSESVPLQEFASVGSAQIEIFSQHGSLKLLKPAYVAEVLDSFAGIDTLQLKEAKAKLRATEKRLAEFETGKLSDTEVEFYQSQIAEIQAAKIESITELEELSAQQEVLAKAQKITDAIDAAKNELTADDDAYREDALTFLKRAQDSLNSLMTDTAGELCQRLENVRMEVSEISYDLAHLKDKIVLDLDRLEAINQRIHLLRSLSKKYGGSLEDVLKKHDQLQGLMQLAKSSKDQKEVLIKERQQLLDDIKDAEMKITQARSTCSKILVDKILSHLKDLAMADARFEIAIKGAGSNDVDFLVATNVSSQAGPVSKVASGGELSRIMLAVNLSFKEGMNYREDGSALVFDEVDTGIGGQTALNIGQALAKLATREQIFVVTHLPQVAAFADSHFLISKNNMNSTNVSIKELDSEARISEVNRMLSGVVGTESGLAHARELILKAQNLVSEK